MQGYIVTGPDIVGAHPKMERYFLMEGDLLVKTGEGTYDKDCPGLAVIGFKLTPEQEARLRPVEYEQDGLSFILTNKEDRDWYASLEA